MMAAQGGKRVMRPHWRCMWHWCDKAGMGEWLAAPTLVGGPIRPSQAPPPPTQGLFGNEGSGSIVGAEGKGGGGVSLFPCSRGERRHEIMAGENPSLGVEEFRIPLE